jgi:hypothetical protein
MSEHVGWFYSWSRQSGDFTLLGIQLLSVLFIFGWTSVLMGTFFYILNTFDLLRIDPLEEEVGMDISRHKGSAYDMSGSARSEKVEQWNTSRRSLLSLSQSSGLNNGTNAVVAVEEKEVDMTTREAS